MNCYSSGVICRKSISINVGSSLIIFDDDSGDPVRTCTGEGCTDGVGIRSSTEAEALTRFFIKGESRGQHWWRKGETLVRSLGGAVIHGHFW